MSERYNTASAVLLIAPTKTLKPLTEYYTPGHCKDASACIIHMTLDDVKSSKLYNHVPPKFQDNLHLFHLWTSYIYHDPILMAILKQLDTLSMGFLLQLEILCTDDPNRPCQQLGAPKCSGCRYKKRTIGVSANGKVDPIDRISPNGRQYTTDETLLNAAMRELREETRIGIGPATNPAPQTMYRMVLARLLSKILPKKSNIKVPELFYDNNRGTRLQLIFAFSHDIYPEFACGTPDVWSHKKEWDICFNEIRANLKIMSYLKHFMVSNDIPGATAHFQEWLDNQ
jgi:8-oxo-dGTP pyrophosphatase MutT (NUDIX family)